MGLVFRKTEKKRRKWGMKGRFVEVKAVQSVYTREENF